MTVSDARQELLASLASMPERLATAARAAATRRVPAGEWTAEQVVRHLIAVETDVHQARLHDLATRPDPRWSWTEPGPWPGEPELDLKALLRRFADNRDETIAMVASLDDAGWARSGRHVTFGALDVAGLLRLAVDHDEEHLGGLARG